MQEQISRSLLLAGSIVAGVGVALGAFGAHGLRSVVSSEMLSVFETAVRYQMYHAFGFLAAGLACWTSAAELASKFKTVGLLFGVGVLLFCGSLYLLALTGVAWLGTITPFGGVSFLVGWLVFAQAFATRK